MDEVRIPLRALLETMKVGIHKVSVGLLRERAYGASANHHAGHAWTNAARAV
jgi:hypothetical protein